MRLKNLPLKKKQHLSFGIVLLLMTIASIFSIYRMSVIKDALDDVTSNWMKRANTISTLNLNCAELRIKQLQHVYTFDETDIKTLEYEIINLIDQINNNIDEYEKLKKKSIKKELYTKSEKKIYSDFNDAWEAYQDYSLDFFLLSRNNQKQEAVQLLNNEAQKTYNELSNSLLALVGLSNSNSIDAAKEAEKVFKRTRSFTITISIITIIISILFAGFITERIMNPITQLEIAAGAVGRGDFDIQIEIDSKDELGRLLKSFKKMALSLKEVNNRNEQQAFQLIAKQNELQFKNNQLKEKTESLESQKKEIEAKNLELENTMHQLKEAQNQLIQSEKMASLGQLTAGIAHEINNPVNFVLSSINPLKIDLEEIIILLEKYQTVIQNKNLFSTFEEVEEFKKEIDYDYLISEIHSLLKGIEEGGRRTSEIVKGLRNFSRLDEEEKKLANIHDGIESTLLMLRNQYKNRIEIIKEYGNVPEFPCYPGKLNQVFMNVLSNAIQAIPDKGEIKITTFLQEETAVIKIIDSGTGISEQDKQKIFEPFFTTKDVGKGTGLGLSISYGIIKDHNGDVEVNSVPDNGTEFIIKLPINK